MDKMSRNQKASKMDNVAMVKIDEAIVKMGKMIERNVDSYGAEADSRVDENISRMEKLLVIRAALSQLYAVPDTKGSEPDENFEAGINPDLLTDPAE